MSATSALASVVRMAKVRIHSPDAGSFQFSQMPALERGASLHGDRVGLLRLLALDRLPLEKAVDRHDAAALAVGLAEGRQVARRLALGVDRFASALRIVAPVGDQSPTQRFERDLAIAVVSPDHQQLLAGRRIPSRRIIVHAAVAHVQAIDDGIAQRSAALNHSSAHAPDIASAIADARSDQRRSPDAAARRDRPPVRPGGSAGYAQLSAPSHPQPWNWITALGCSGGRSARGRSG